MMQRIIFLLLALLATQSCKKSGKAPVSKETMQHVLADIHIAEAYSMVLDNHTLSQPNTKNIDSLGSYYATILKHYKLSPEDFSESLKWYQAHPDMLDSIYVGMLPEMSKIESGYINKD